MELSILAAFMLPNKHDLELVYFFKLITLKFASEYFLARGKHPWAACLIQWGVLICDLFSPSLSSKLLCLLMHYLPVDNAHQINKAVIQGM